MTGSGAGSRLPTAVLLLAGVSAVIAVAVSCWSILLQLRNYRKPALQRMVVRIMLMVPLYAIASLISLYSLEAAFVIDAIRDIYEAFVIYCFFVLLLSYLGGERSLLIMLHGRPPKEPLFPINLFKREIDVSDPYTFLFLKRGILQYVQVKRVLAAATLILKALGRYSEGDFRANSGYLYISIIYNISICLALYCLAIFWLCVSEDLTPFRVPIDTTDSPVALARGGWCPYRSNGYLPGLAVNHTTVDSSSGRPKAFTDRRTGLMEDRA